MIYCDHAQQVTRGIHGLVWRYFYSDMKGFCDRGGEYYHAVFFESVKRRML